MSDDRSSHDPGDRSWIEKIAHVFSSEPRTREDLLEVMRVAQDNQIIDADVRNIVEGALQVGAMQVRDIMVPRPQMEVIRSDQPLDKILPRIIEAGHSRYPVIGEALDEVLGILLAKDLLPQLQADGETFDLLKLLRPVMFVPESKRVNVLLREFRESRNHMAIVIDEYGGVSGLVTIEDVLEEIVGDIEDEHDVEEDVFIRKIAEDDYIIKALTPIEDFNERFQAQFSDEEFDTIGGIILQTFGYLPRRNEVATIDGYQFKVLNADNRQIHLLRMTPVAEH